MKARIDDTDGGKKILEEKSYDTADFRRSSRAEFMGNPGAIDD
jgi:hypothetical protein